MQPSLLSFEAPRTRRLALDRRPAARLSIHIEEVVLDGFERVDIEKIRSALRQSLSASIQGVGRPGFERDVNLEKAGGTLDLQPGTDSRQIGAQLGEAVMRALQGAGRSSGQATPEVAAHNASRQGNEGR